MEDLFEQYGHGCQVSDASLPQSQSGKLFLESLNLESAILAEATCFTEAFRNELEPCACLEFALTSTNLRRSRVPLTRGAATIVRGD